MTRSRIILAIGWLAFLVYAYPGLMTRDPYDQLIEARSGVLSDAHPPLMQAIWQIIDYFVAGGFGIIVLQTSTFVAGLYLLARRAMSARNAAIAAVALLWFPPIGAVMAVVWKDCLMAGLLTLGIALVLADARRTKLAGLALLCAATACRYNAFGATLPPIVLGFVWSERFIGWRRYALASAVWLGVTVVAFGTNALLTEKPTHYWHASLGVNDIVGTLAFTRTDVEDRKIRRALEGAPLIVQHDIHKHIRTHYKPDEHVWTVIGPHRMFAMSLTESAPPDQRVAIERAWKTVIFGRPLAYLRHRVEVFRCVLGLIGKSWDKQIIATHPHQNKKELTELGIPTGYSWFQEVIGDIYSWCSHTWLFRPYIYFFLALLLLRRTQRDIVILLASGLLVELSLFFIGPSSDFRYSHWLVVVTVLAIIMRVARGYREGET